MRNIWFLLLCITAGLSCHYSAKLNPAFLSGQIDVNRTYQEEIKIHLEIIREKLEQYHEISGEYPDMEKGLTVLWPAISGLPEFPPSGTAGEKDGPFQAESQRYNCLEKIDSSTFTRELLFNQRLTVTPINVYSIYGVPLIYENPGKIPSSSLSFSPVKKDFVKKFSVKVDENIFIYSTAGVILQSQIDRFTAILENNHRKANVIMAACTSCSIILLILFFRAPVPESGKLASLGRYSFRAAAVIITLLICAFTSIPQLVPAGFAPGPHARREVLTVMKPIMNKYREMNLISENRLTDILKEIEAIDKIIQ